MRRNRKEGMLERARDLRTRSTDAENKLWSFIRAKRLQGYKFRRQYIIATYIVDFVCLEKNLIIELDGSQHLEAIEYDQERTQFLSANGYRVLRFWNNELIENLERVLSKILDELESPLPALRPPLPNPLP